MTGCPPSRLSRLLTAALFTAALSAVRSGAQTAPAPPPCPPAEPAGSQSSARPPKSCPPPASENQPPSAAQKFPFPGESSAPAAAPNSPTPPAKPSSAAAQHPFPSETPPKLPGDDSSSSSSSADDPNTTPDTPTPAPGEEGSSVHRHHLPKVQHVQSDDERVDEDLKVAKFYLNDDNLPGAYLRAQDAVKTQPDYSATHFTLAQVAEKMKKKDQAIAEYQTYLKLDPDGEKAKAARSALAQLR